MNEFYVYIHMDEAGEVRYVGKGRGRRAYVKKDRNLYWKNIFSKQAPIVDFVAINLSEQEAFDLEIEMIKVYKEDGHKLCNMTEGGEGCSGHTHTAEARQKISKAGKGRVTSKETRHKMSEVSKGTKSHMYGKHLPIETRQKISEANMGTKNHMYGKTHTPEAKKKLSEALIGKLAGEKNPAAKLSNSDVLAIMELISKKIKGAVIAKKFNVSRDTIYRIKYNKRWKHLGE